MDVGKFLDLGVGGGVIEGKFFTLFALLLAFGLYLIASLSLAFKLFATRVFILSLKSFVAVVSVSKSSIVSAKVASKLCCLTISINFLISFL